MGEKHDQWVWGILGTGIGLVLGVVIMAVLISQNYHDNVPRAIELVINFFVAVGTIAAAAYAAIRFRTMREEKRPLFSMQPDNKEPHCSAFTIKNLNFHNTLLLQISCQISHPKLRRVHVFDCRDWIKTPAALPMLISCTSDLLLLRIGQATFQEEIFNFFNKNNLSMEVLTPEFVEPVQADFTLVTSSEKPQLFSLREMSPALLGNLLQYVVDEVKRR